MVISLAAGFALGLSLIVAIGAQNMFVLRQGLRREHVVAVAAVCAASDAALIAVGVSGVGTALSAMPVLVEIVRWAGAVFLACYAVLAARRALRPSDAALRADHAPTASAATPQPHGAVSTATRARPLPVLATCLALTWLNPHVYLDTVLLLGTIAQSHGDLRWWFGLGAMIASAVWFFGLAFGARALAPVLARPIAWRVLDGLIAVVMLAIAASLVLPH